MPPRYKFTKEEIINAGVEIVRTEGSNKLSARSIACRLGSSPKVIFGLFNGMGELNEEIIKASQRLYEQSILSAMKSSKLPYKASGLAYINFAKNETNLFKLLFIENRIDTREEDKSMSTVYDALIKALNVTMEQAKIIHLEAWAYVHGIATLVAMGVFDISDELISNMLTDYFNGVRLRVKENNGSN